MFKNVGRMVLRIVSHFLSARQQKVSIYLKFGIYLRLTYKNHYVCGAMSLISFITVENNWKPYIVVNKTGQFLQKNESMFISIEEPYKYLHLNNTVI